MADPVLHIKDSYYFEVPKVLYPYDYKSARQFPPLWVSLDSEFQDWEFGRLYQELSVLDAGLPPKDAAHEEWHHWLHADHANFAKPFDVFLDEKYQAQVAKFSDWKAARVEESRQKNDGTVETAQKLGFSDYVEHLKTAGTPDQEYLSFLSWRGQPGASASFDQAREKAGGNEAIKSWQAMVGKDVTDWDAKKIEDYNHQLSGKILIPQPFATLRNFYEKESGFAISKYMIIEVIVGLIVLMLFSQLAKNIEHGHLARGKLWNLLEVFLVFIRDQVAKPVLGSHDHSHDDEHSAAEHGHGEHGHGHGHGEHGHVAAAHGHDHHAAADPATRFLPLLWTIFFFVLGCNLMGMLPWAGAPTAAFGVTAALALITFTTVLVAGMIQFGIGGFFLNQIPGMDLPWYMAIIIKPMILAIELLGLCIKHGVLAVRLLANMVAGHLVILGIMGLAFGADAAMRFSAPGVAGWQWGLTAVIAVVASAAFNILELFVAFLQAYIITFLSALFIGAAIHKH